MALPHRPEQEIFYVKEQFSTHVPHRLDVLSGQLDDIDGELRKSRLDTDYFGVRRTSGTSSGKLYVLYEAVMGLNSFGESVLDVVERYVSRNRRLLEDFSVRLEGALLPGGIQDEGRHRGVRGAFPEQAKTDAERLLKEKDGQELPDVAQALREFLAGEVRLGAQVNNVNLVSPTTRCRSQKVPRDLISRLMEGRQEGERPGRGGGPGEAAGRGSWCTPSAATRRAQPPGASPRSRHYWERHKNVAVCVHPE
ncbi:unnamed protein product [Gadus morhua 'NCC']